MPFALLARQLRHLLALAAACLAAGCPVAASPPPNYPPGYRLQAFALPDPAGRYAVGTLSFTVRRAGGDPLRVIAWYPAEAASGTATSYLGAAEQRIQAPAIARNFQWPATILADVASLPTHAHAGAAVARGRFPLLIFSHGYLSYPRQNTALMEHLAARGYVVLSLAHPGDAADLPTADGVLPTISPQGQRQPDISKLHAFWEGSNDRARVKALPGFWRALRGGRMLASLDRWRGDIMALANAVSAGLLPPEAQPLGKAIDAGKRAYLGMSFGGSASVSACQRDRQCRAAINLDGFEFDRRLYDRSVRAPLLLVQSDWSIYPNMGPPNREFTDYDYAYERWADAGSTPSVYRFRITGVRHLGLTDLVLAPHDPVRNRIFGPADGSQVTAAIDDLVEAFLDRHLAGKPVDIAAVAAAHPIVQRHDAGEIARWYRDGGRHEH